MAYSDVKLYWSPSDFNDPLMGAVDCLDEGISLPHPGMLFDQFGAQNPEDARLPISYWTKRRIIFYAYESKKIPHFICGILEKMSLVDIRTFALKFVGKNVTGNLRTFMGFHTRGEWRNTSYYSLDIENINFLWKVA